MRSSRYSASLVVGRPVVEGGRAKKEERVRKGEGRRKKGRKKSTKGEKDILNARVTAGFRTLDGFVNHSTGL